MRRVVTFSCEGASLAATIDEGACNTGLLIVSGGNEIRIGAHRGMAQLAADIAAAGYPVFRFDRRGIGDSEGDNGGFEASAADLAAAIPAFRQAAPGLSRIVAFGNCDAASALLLHRPEGVDALVLANIWTIETIDDLPPPAAIKARYLERMKDPKAWIGLLTGAVNLRKLLSGLRKIAAQRGATASPASLAGRIADGLAALDRPATILLASRDATALAFKQAWLTGEFSAARANARIELAEIDSASHSFA